MKTINKTNPVITTLLALPLATLVGCQSAPKVDSHIRDTLDNAIAQQNEKKAPKPLTLPNSVKNSLLQQQMADAKQGLLAEKRLQISANQVPAAQFFAALVDDSPYSVAVNPDVTGKISLHLKDVTIDQALSVIQELYGYDIRVAGNVIQVYPAGMRTETIPLNYLFVKRFGLSSTSINSGGVSENDPNNSNNSTVGNNNSFSRNNNLNNNNSINNQNSQNGSRSGINIYTQNESDFWSELKQTLTNLIGKEKGRSVLISPQAGLVTVRALPNEIKAVKDFIQSTEQHLHRQVIIEAKILEVTLNNDYQQGIKWNEVLSHVGSTDFNFSTAGQIGSNAITSAIGGTTALSFVNQDFSGVINLLSTQGNVQVLSSPRITATNNQKAVIKVGQDEYFVTDVSSTTTTGTSTTTTPQIDLTPFFSGIALDVTPQINGNGEVVLHVHPSVSVTSEQVKTITLNQEDIVLPLAQSSVRESDTVVRAKSGEIVVIGGLIETRKVDQTSKTPLLGDIPVVGELFTSKTKTTQKKELVIMLKPVVTGQDTWKEQLQDARSLLQQWFPESK